MVKLLELQQSGDREILDDEYDPRKTKTELFEELTSLRRKIATFKAEDSMQVFLEQALRDGLGASYLLYEVSV